MPRIELVVGVAIALAVLIGIARLVRRAGVGGRTVALAMLGIASGALLYLTLFPPPVALGGETLVVATAGAPTNLRAQTGERLVALPEAPAVTGSERVPDLATALRRHTRVERLRVVGAGLTARDRPVAARLPLAFAPPPVPRGLIALAPPDRTAAGASFAVGARASGLMGGTAELLDPAGRRVDTVTIGPTGDIALIGSARTAGVARFTLRLRDRNRAPVSDTVVPLWTVPDRPVRVLLLGAPGPETKYLRRWATDAGIALQSQFDTGGGVRLGDAPIVLGAGALRGFDAVVLDDRSWAAMGGATRAALAGAAADGLGLVLRLTAPASPALRREWAALGVAFSDGGEAAPVKLPPLAVDAVALSAQQGPADPESDESAALDDPTPDLTRWTVRFGAGQVPVIRDDAGTILAAWRTRGAGRVAVMTVPDSYALVLGGQRDRYGDWWSSLLSTIARGEAVFAPTVTAPARVGERVTICGLDGASRVRGPAGAMVGLADEPGGCGGYWPVVAGFHTVVGRGGGERPFLVRTATDMPAAVRYEMREATRQLAGATPPPRSAWSDGARGANWPWFLGWLAVSATLWWLERRRRA